MCILCFCVCVCVHGQEDTSLLNIMDTQTSTLVILNYVFLHIYSKQTSTSITVLWNKNISYPELVMQQQTIYLPVPSQMSRSVSDERNSTNWHVLKSLVHETHPVLGFAHKALCQNSVCTVSPFPSMWLRRRGLTPQISTVKKVRLAQRSHVSCFPYFQIFKPT